MSELSEIVMDNRSLREGIAMGDSGLITRVERFWLLANFKKQLKKREQESALLDKLQKCLDLLHRDPRNPGLNVEKLRNTGKYAVYSARLSVAFRLIFVQITKTEIGLLHFDSDHDAAYRWLDQNSNRISTMLGKDEEYIRSVPITNYIKSAMPAVGYDEDAPLAVASAEQFRQMVAGGLARYLAHLDPEQQALVNLNVTNLLLIKGGAGTGKTAVAVHRALAAARQMRLAETGPGSVLYLCYNTRLAQVARQLIGAIVGSESPVDVQVNTFHTWCYDYLQRTGGSPQVDEDGCRQAVFRAFRATTAEQKAALAGQDGSFVDDEIVQVIKHNNITTMEAYGKFDRHKRKVRGFKQDGRAVVWAIHEAAEALQRQRGICRYSDHLLLALQRLGGDETPPAYRAIVIDEGQDCSPVMVRLARQLLGGSKGQLTVLADPAQAIYDCGFQWTQQELRPKGGNVRYLRKNYRTTRQIYDLAGGLLDREEESREDREQMRPPDRLGPRPLLTVVGDEKLQLTLLAAKVEEALSKYQPNQIAILGATWSVLRRTEKQLRAHGLPISLQERSALALNEPMVKLLSMHGVKGLDFPMVFVIAPKSTDLGGKIHAELPETRRVLYVALTRASDRLTILVLDCDHHHLLENLDPECYDTEGDLAQGFLNRRGTTLDPSGQIVQRV